MISVRTNKALVRAARGATRHFVIDLDAPLAAAGAARSPLRVAVVLDRSGSMAGQKLELAVVAAARALRLLRPDDVFTAVVYDHGVDVVAPAVEASRAAIDDAVALLERAQPGGGTNLSGGWLGGCEQLSGVAPGTPGRCLLLTDGQANAGVTEPDALAQLAAAQRDAGIVTSTFGVGADFDEVLLQRIAQDGGGNFYFVDDPRQIPDYLASELGEALEVVARGVTLRLDVPEGCQPELLTGFPVQAADGGIVCQVGELVSGQRLRVAGRIRLPATSAGAPRRLGVHLRDADGQTTAAAELIWTGADDVANDAEAPDRDVDRAVAEAMGWQARREALDLNRRLDYRGAMARLDACADALRAFAGSDDRVRGLIERLEADRHAFGRRMDARRRIAEDYESYTSMRSRHLDGAAMRKLRDDEV